MKNGSTPLIHLENVTKVFLTDEVETHALSGIHLDIRPGEYVSIAGPSGCGKSTLLSILGLLDAPSDGSYSLKGDEVANLSFPDRARIRNREIGFIFQSFNLIGDLTVYENVELPLTYRGMAASERKGFSDRSARPRRDGTSGQTFAESALRRSAAARGSGARACRETGHSSGRRTDWQSRFAKWRSGDGFAEGTARCGATICMVTHDERFAQHADRTVHLFDGRVVEDNRIAA